MSDLAELVSKSSQAYRNRSCHCGHNYYPVWFPRPELLQVRQQQVGRTVEVAPTTWTYSRKIANLEIRLVGVADKFQASSLDHNKVVKATVFFIWARVDLPQTAIRMKLHPLHLLASVLLQPAERQSGHSEAVINPAANGIYDDKPVAICSTSPNRLARARDVI